MLSAINLSCERNDRILFHSVSFTLSAGEVLHIRGANGRGKTSLIRILLGLAEPNTGEVCWQQHSIHQQRAYYNSVCCYIGHKVAVKACLTPRELLKQYCSQPTIIGAALTTMGLAAYLDAPCQQLSEGQQRRVALSRLLLHEQPLWLLDEPFTALDAAATVQLERLITEHAAQGGITVLSSHQDGHLQNLALQSLNLDDYANVC